MSILYFAIVGLAAGWLAGKVIQGNTSSLVTDLIVGVIGAVLGGFLFGLLMLPRMPLVSW